MTTSRHWTPAEVAEFLAQVKVGDRLRSQWSARPANSSKSKEWLYEVRGVVDGELVVARRLGTTHRGHTLITPSMLQAGWYEPVPLCVGDSQS